MISEHFANQYHKKQETQQLLWVEKKQTFHLRVIPCQINTPIFLNISDFDKIWHIVRVFMYTKKNTKFYQNISTGCRNTILKIPKKLRKKEHSLDIQTAIKSLKNIIGG